jgi:hypothetical protein
MGLNWGVKQVTHLLSYRIRKAAKRRRVSYSFLFMKASGDQLRQIGTLVDAGPYGPSSIASNPSSPSRKPWPTWNQAEPRGRSSSG